MSFTIFTFSMIILLLNNSVYTTGTNRAAELAENVMISAGGQDIRNFYDYLVASLAGSNIESINAIVRDVDRCEVGTNAVIIGEDEQIASIARQASILISAAADRCARRIEQIIQQLSARLVGTAGSAIALADSQIKLTTSEINAITDRTVGEAQLIASSALATAERSINSAAELAVEIAQSDTNAIKVITDVVTQQAKRLADGLAGRITVATVS